LTGEKLTAPASGDLPDVAVRSLLHSTFGCALVLAGRLGDQFAGQNVDVNPFAFSLAILARYGLL
jgi:hypothetical protein